MLQKMWHKRWMTLSLLVGCVLLVATAISFPLYQKAAYDRMLQDEFHKNISEEGRFPTVLSMATISKKDEYNDTEFKKLRETVEKLFPLVHEKLEKTVLNGTLIYHWEGADKEKQPVLFMGHQDVVPASDDGWSVPAYSGVVKDGCLYGRGALD